VLAAGVGVGGGQPGRSARAWRSLAADQPCETRVSPRGEARSHARRRRVAAGGATRSGGGGPHDRPMPKKLVRRVFEYTFPYRSIEIEIEIVYNMYRMRRFTLITVCAGCWLWALPTMQYMKLTS
jgi:hypothetical protein